MSGYLLDKHSSTHVPFLIPSTFGNWPFLLFLFPGTHFSSFPSAFLISGCYFKEKLWEVFLDPFHSCSFTWEGCNCLADTFAFSRISLRLWLVFIVHKQLRFSAKCSIRLATKFFIKYGNFVLATVVTFGKMWS